MKIFEVKQLAFPEVKVVRFARFADNRGYFTEPFRSSDFQKVIPNFTILQVNESYSQKNVIRGLHFQWNPYMGKLVRTVRGHMVDLFLDIRIGSPTFGKIAAYDMPTSQETDFAEWIWVPVGFAHGNFFLEETIIEYLCTGEYSLGCEAGISPVAPDLDWSLCDSGLKKQFDMIVENNPLISDKDKVGLTITQWKNDERSKNFLI